MKEENGRVICDQCGRVASKSVRMRRRAGVPVAPGEIAAQYDSPWHEVDSCNKHFDYLVGNRTNIGWTVEVVRAGNNFNDKSERFKVTGFVSAPTAKLSLEKVS